MQFDEVLTTRMLNALEPGTVLFEAKDGAWEPLEKEDIMK